MVSQTLADHQVSESSVQSAAATLPNYLHLGPAKAGSTWIFNLLKHHPDVFVASGKGLYYFDAHYEYGDQWYLEFFRGTDEKPVRADVSHGYLPSPWASERIWNLNPAMKMTVCLREPVSRSFSAYLDGLKNGRYPESTSFDEAVEIDPTILDHSRYATHLSRYLYVFGRDQILPLAFDDLSKDPQRIANQLFDFLEVDRIPMTRKLTSRQMPAGKPRLKLATQLAKSGSRFAQALGMRGLRGSIKTSRLVRYLLYAPYTEKNRPTMDQSRRDELKEYFRDEVLELDKLMDADFASRWNYI